MFGDLCALRQTLAQCLALEENSHLRQWYTALNRTLPLYELAFDEVQQALSWVAGVKNILAASLPTLENPGVGGEAIAQSGGISTDSTIRKQSITISPN
jgi:hypothetical protein